MISETVSVIVPVYEAESYILRCVTSVLCQTYEHLEVILIDDGSTDRSFKICSQLVQQDSRVHVYHQKNQGVAAARNKGIEYATGEFIFFLDSDDWIDKITLLEMVSTIKKYGTEICLCGFCYESESSYKNVNVGMDFTIAKNKFMNNLFWELYEKAILFNIGTKLYKTDIIKKNNIRFCENMMVYEDICFFFDYMSYVNDLSFCKGCFYHYFQENSNSITHSYKKEFWKNTMDYCNVLTTICNSRTIELDKAIIQCLYRAFLQEGHNPQLGKKTFLDVMKRYCFPLSEKVKYKKELNSYLTMDERIFWKIVSKQRNNVLWVLIKIISIKGKFI